MTARILCRIGWHSWKPVFRFNHHLAPFFMGTNLWKKCWWTYFFQAGHKCRRCGKRVRL